MRCEKIKRALICYAGSAPEASIGSKPIGSELEDYIGLDTLISQEFSPRKCDATLFGRQFAQPQATVFINIIGSPQPSVMLK